MIRRIAASVMILILTMGIVGCQKQDGNQSSGQELLEMDWESILEEAKGTTVTFYGYGGDEKTNNWIDTYVAKELKEKYDITLKRVGMNIQISAGAAYYDCLQNMGDIIKMADRDLYKEKRVKKSKEKQNSEKLKHLLLEIEKLRDELNKKVTLEGKGINNEETLKLSQRLDELIVKHLLDE